LGSFLKRFTSRWVGGSAWFFFPNLVGVFSFFFFFFFGSGPRVVTRLFFFFLQNPSLPPRGAMIFFFFFVQPPTPPKKKVFPLFGGLRLGVFRFFSRGHGWAGARVFFHQPPLLFPSRGTIVFFPFSPGNVDTTPPQTPKNKNTKPWPAKTQGRLDWLLFGSGDRCLFADDGVFSSFLSCCFFSGGWGRVVLRFLRGFFFFSFFFFGKFGVLGAGKGGGTPPFAWEQGPP